MTLKYCAPTGNNGNAGTIGSPYLTIQHCVEALSPGDTCYIRGGTYDEVIEYGYAMANGTSPSNTTKLLGYPGETVIVRPTANQYAMQTSTYAGAIQYRTYGNMIWDCVNATHNPTPPNSQCMQAGGGWLYFNDIEIKNGTGTLALVECYFCEFTRMPIHDNRGFNTLGGVDNRCYTVNCGDSTGSHGLYLTGADNIVQDCEFYNLWGYGLHQFASGHSDQSRMRVRRSLFHSNCVGNTIGGCFGMRIGNGSDNQAYDNIVYNETTGGIEIASTCTDCAAYHNTIYNVGYVGLMIGNGGSGGHNAAVKNNIVYLSGSTPIWDSSDGTAVVSNNLTSDPHFVNAGSFDFHIQSDSAARGAGVDVGIVSDFDGLLYAAPPSIGAFEFDGDTPPPDAEPPVELFAYTAGDNLDGKTGGTGWTGPWSNLGADPIEIAVGPGDGDGGNAAICISTTHYCRALRDFDPVNSGILRAVLRISSATPNDSAGVFWNSIDGTNRCIVRFGPTGQFEAYDGDLAEYVALEAYGANESHQIAVQIDVAGHPDQFRVAINEGTPSAWINADGSFTSIGNCEIYNGADGTTMYVDSIGLNFVPPEPVTPSGPPIDSFNDYSAGQNLDGLYGGNDVWTTPWQQLNGTMTVERAPTGMIGLAVRSRVE